MKKLILLLFVFANSALHLAAQPVYDGYKFLLPKPNPATLSAVAILTPSKWIAGGNSGVYMVTENAGLTWSTMYNFRRGITSIPSISGLHFFDHNTGLIACSDGYLGRTTNGGFTWDSISTGSTASIRKFNFIDNNTGYVCGSNGFVAKTTNAGTSWTPVNTGVSTIIYNVSALDTNNLFISTQSGNLRITTDAGATWTAKNAGTTQSLLDLKFFDANTGYVCGVTFVKKTTNGGNNWSNILSYSNHTWFDMAFYSGVSDPGGSEVLYFCGHNSNNVTNLYRLYNGVTLDSVDMRAGRPVWGQTSDIKRVGNLLVSVNNVGMVAYSNDMGNTWNPSGSYVSNLRFSDVEFHAPSGKMWACANSSGVNLNNPVYSTNRGATWSLADTRLNSMSSLLFINENTGYAAGGATKIFKTTTGGVTWDSLPVYVNTFGFLKIFAEDSNTLFTVGGNGTMVKTTNSGNNWSTLSVGTTNAIYSGQSFGTDDLFIVGGISSGGWVRRSTDGGLNWNVIFSTANTLRGIKMFNDGTGFACGNGAQFYKTTNLGVNWTQITLPFIGDISKMEFTDVNTGYINVPDLFLGARIAKTTDGGLTWNTILGPDPTTSGIDAFRVIHPDTVLATGTSGVVSLLFTGNSSSILKLNLSYLIEGFYNGTHTFRDTVRIFLRSSSSPYEVIDSSKGILDTNGNISLTFQNAVNSTPYYISVKHRNSIETWSNAVPGFNSGFLSYNFTNSISQAYGNNLTLVGSKFCSYSGDVNQDGIIEATDGSSIDNDSYSFAFGYIATDVTGNGIVDGSDAAIADNNAANFISVIRP